MSTEVTTITPKPLSVIERASLVFATVPREEDLRELVTASASIVTITNDAGRDQCHSALMKLKNTRLEIARTGEEGREDAVQTSKAIIARQKALIQITQPEEDRLAAIREVWDARIAAEKEARIAAEVARVSEIQRRIEGIRGWPVHASTQGSLLVGQMLVQADAYVIDPAVFEEFTQQARDALMTSRAALSGLLAQRKEHEAEQAKIIAEREELAKLRADAAERERITALAQAEADAAARAERERLEAIAKTERDAETARQVEANRLEREKQEANRQRNEMALQEIQAIHHQIIIADTGRAPYCKGGDLHSMDWVLAQTEKWPITEDHFGALFAMAEKTKESTLASLRRKRADLVESMERAARQAELDAQGEAQRKALADETAALAAQRAALEKEQEAIRKAAEPKPKPRRAPTGAELTEVVAKHYGVETKIAVAWLTKINWKEATAA